MAKKVIWSLNADQDFDSITEYLLENWPFSVSEKFVLDTYEVIDLISYYPRLGRESDKIPGVRKIPINKYISLFYGIEEDEVILYNFFDNRQDFSS